MAEAEQTSAGLGNGTRDRSEARRLRDFLWSLPQPLVAFGSMALVASAIRYGWTDADRLTSILLLMPIPVLLLCERLAPKRREWVLNWKEYAEDAFWVGCVYLIWAPLYDDVYDTPISQAFVWLRDASALGFSLEADSMLGLMGMALLGIFVSEFIYYWLHRLQHSNLFFWRMHATHHHITKMSAARGDRTHPLEFLALNLGPAVTLAFLGASDDVVAVAITFRIWSAYTNHCNLPLKSGFHGWLFTTAEWHQLHHSLDMKQSSSNYGCTVILWDRLFGTFDGTTQFDRIGNGTGRALSIWMQLSMPFRSNTTLREL